MKRIAVYIVSLFCLFVPEIVGQNFTNNPAPYGGVSYFNVPCNQTGPSQTPGNVINDFVNTFTTSGANVDIVNVNSGCNGLSNNYIYYLCQHFLAVSPGQTITANIQPGMFYPQGYAIWIDWNQDNLFASTLERVGFTNVITWPSFGTTTFVIPAWVTTGTYRMRVRSSYFTNGNSTFLDAYNQQTYGETEDYNIFVGAIPVTIITATASSTPSSVCVGQNINLSVVHSSTATPTFTWTGPGGFLSNVQNPVLSAATPTMSGTYSLTVGNGVCPVSKTVSVTVVSYPQFTMAPPSATICQGGTTPLGVTINGGANPFNFQWTGPGLLFNPSQPNTLVQPPLQPVNVTLTNLTYSLTVTPKALSCPVTQTMNVTVNNPLTPTLNMPAPLCNISTPVQLSATPGGGTWTSNPSISQGGLLTPALSAIGTNTVSYSVAVGTCVVSNSNTFQVSQFRTPALTSSVSLKCVQDPSFNLQNIVQDTSGWWFGQNVNANLFMPAGLATGTYALTHTIQSKPNPTVCPAFTVLTISVFNPPTPYINPIASKCTNSGTVQLTASPLVQGVWSGNSGVSPLGIQNPSLNLIGTNTVSYTSGQGTCVATSSRTFFVSQFNPATLTGTVGHLCATSPAFNLMSIVQNTNGSWSGPAVNNNIFNPTGQQTAIYTLSYKTNSTPIPLCSDSSVIKVSVLNPPTPVITFAGPYCSADGPVQMTVTPNTGSWVTTSYLNASGVYTPSLSAIGNNLVQYVIGTNTCNAKHQIFVTTEAFVPATILYQIPPLCNNSAPVNLTPFTANNLGTWLGQGIIGSSFYPAVTGAGGFTVAYKTASFPSGLCPDKSIMAVNVYSLAPPTISHEGPYCNNASPFQFKVSPLGGVFGGTDNGALTPSGIFNPGMAAIGNNLVSYSISVGPCLAYAQTIISIEKFVSARFGKQLPATMCINQAAFDLNAYALNPGGNWSGPGIPNGSSIFDPAKANLGGNNIVVHETHSETTSLCPDTTAARITVKNIPKVSINSSLPSGCSPLKMTFNMPSTTEGSGYWTFGDGTPVSEGFNVNHIFTDPGTYQVLFNYYDGEAQGCSTQVSLPSLITVKQSPEADFDAPTEITLSNPEVRLVNTSKGLMENYYSWNVDGVGHFTDLHPLVDFPTVGKYRITLTASSTDGCTSETVKFIDVKNEFNVFIPNSFTPNYDGLNDIFIPVFTPYGLDTKNYLLEIYDRWGHLIFASKDHTKGWDGTFQNRGDQILKEDTYVYRLKFRDLDGMSHYKTGNFSLLH
jgi:gliding motility-associated-like protein